MSTLAAFPSYQRVLRVVGAFLDQEAPGRFRLIEGADTMHLVIERGGAAPQVHVETFPIGLLHSNAEQMVRGKKLFRAGHGANWALSSANHEDMLRAIGYELDDVSAKNLALEETPDALLFSYSFVDAAQGYGYKKNLKVLSKNDIQALLDAAYARRQKRGILRLRH